MRAALLANGSWQTAEHCWLDALQAVHEFDGRSHSRPAFVQSWLPYFWLHLFSP